MAYNNRGGDASYRFNRARGTQRLLASWYERIDQIRQSRGKRVGKPLEERVIIYAAPTFDPQISQSASISRTHSGHSAGSG